ncbi:MAG TPA: porin [Acetobacteraceae bacterium]|nr:porin [Acetobacteraceae bacterium]
MFKTRTVLLAATSALVLAASHARADEYTDLLDILKAKGSLSQSEYRSLMAKHMHNMRHHRGLGEMAPSEEETGASTAAAQAAASAAAAQAAARQMQDEMSKTEAMMAAPDIVHAMPYKPGAGVTLKVGDVDLNISGIVNAFYTFSDGGSNNTHSAVAGGLTEATGFDSSSVRNGLLPGALIISAATQQDGIDLTAVFGMYPGINNSAVGSLNANNGGNATALGTTGIDFRKTYLTAGTPTFGTIKLGRDIGLFGQDAILNDQTLLGVGASGGNADPGNTSLGRIGYGYIYTDWLPQITYISPKFAGLQGSLGIMTPFNGEPLFTGYNDPTNPYGGGLSGESPQHSSPMFQGRLTYDYKSDLFSAHVWAGFVDQQLDDISHYNPLVGTITTHSKDGFAGEGGAVVTVGPVAVTGYYYKGSGVGTTGLFLDSIGANGETRDSEGGYIQGAVSVTPKVKVIGSYGESSLYEASGEQAYWTALGEPGALATLVSRNESETGGVYYAVTPWLTALGEYTHAESHSHGPYNSRANSVSVGAILFY